MIEVEPAGSRGAGRREGSWCAPVAELEQTRGHWTLHRTRSRAMRPFGGFAWGWALAVLAAGGTTAQAAWNNVFQVCCNHCRSSPAPVVAAYGCDPCPSPCPAPCPQPTTTCTTRYVQRSCYTPV